MNDTPDYSVHIDGPPIILDDNAVLDGKHVLIQGSSYGRILFKQGVGVIVAGRNVVVKNNLIRYVGSL